MAYWKYVWLTIVRFLRKFFNRLPTMFSYFFLAFSVAACLVILFPNCFDRVPVLSYYISEHELPITYELNGKVKVLGEDGEVINKNVEVFVGGYSTHLAAMEFNLNFSSPMVNEVFVVIRYEVDGEICEFTKCIEIKEGKHSLNEEFIIYA